MALLTIQDDEHPPVAVDDPDGVTTAWWTFDEGTGSSVTDSGRSRTPVATADRPSATDKNSGTAKNRPACSRYWNRNEISPPRRVRLRASTRLGTMAPDGVTF